jgi:NADH-quinone oxidoreductase subunit H
MTVFQIFITILKSLIIIVPVLIAVAFFTLLERKIMAGIQRRRGPNVVGLLGVLQPFADGLKLLIKETIIPSRANKIIFLLAPILALFLSFLNYSVLPFSLFNVFADINLGILYIFAISSLSVYGIIMSG